MIIRAWIQRVWETKSLAKRIEMVNKFNLPYKSKSVLCIKQSLISAYKFGRDRAKSVVSKSNKFGRKLKKQFATAQEFIDADVFVPTGAMLFEWNDSGNVAFTQELVEDEQVYARVAATYSAWSEKLGTDLWQRKVTSTKNAMIRGIQEGWGLRPIGHYSDNKGNKVTAYEATGGKGGPENVLSGYGYVEDTPGILNEAGKELEPYGYQGWQVERLVRTEFTRAMNDGLLAIYKEDDAIVAYSWDAIIDFNTCQECAMMNGVVMEIGDPRLSYYEPPLHCSCRCILQPVFAWELMESNFDKERSVTLYDRDGNPFDLTYTPNQISPDFLRPIRPANDAAGIKRQLITKKESDALRANFVSATPQERFEKWMNN